MHDPRRTGPRIDVEALCWELVEGSEASGMIVDLAASGGRSIGVRLERPYLGGRTRRHVQLELEVPGIDEVMWARGDVCFDHLVPCKTAGPMGLVRRTGYRLGSAAARDLRLLEEFVVETHRAREKFPFANELMMASCYARA
jgi:hypothetical protein